MIFIFDTIIVLIGLLVFAWYVRRWYRKNFITAEGEVKTVIREKSEQLDSVAEALFQEKELRKKFENIVRQFGDSKL